MVLLLILVVPIAKRALNPILLLILVPFDVVRLSLSLLV